MAKTENGFFGKMSGKVGSVVLSSWKGIPYIRSKPQGNSSNSRAQKIQRMKFKKTLKFLNRIKPVINAGFKWDIKNKTELNSATSYVMKYAIKDLTPADEADEINVAIDFPKLLVARGELASPEGAGVSAGEDGIVFRWDL